MILHRAEMHSSFVVFYFVFVLWLLPDVSRGVVFYIPSLFQSTLSAEATAEDFIHKLYLFAEDAEYGRA